MENIHNMLLLLLLLLFPVMYSVALLTGVSIVDRLKKDDPIPAAAVVIY